MADTQTIRTAEGTAMSEKLDELDTAQVRLRNAEAELAEVRAAREREFLHGDWARDNNNGVYTFDDDVTRETCASCASWIRRYSRRNPGKPIEIRFTSRGGSCYHGLALGAAIKQARNDGHEVTGYIAGQAGSMAGVLIQFCSRRVIAEDSWLHVHEASSIAYGKASEQVDSAEQTKRLTRQICEIYAKRSHAMNADEILEWIERHERNLDATEALERGFVDFIDQCAD